MNRHPERSDRNSLKLRAQEILSAHPEGMTTREAFRQALAERFKDDPVGLLEYATTASDALMKGLRQRTYDLPDPGDSLLFDIPPVIGISTPEGDLLIGAESASIDQVRQWDREARQHLATQKLRRERFHVQTLEPLRDLPPETPWIQARAALMSILGIEAADEPPAEEAEEPGEDEASE